MMQSALSREKTPTNMKNYPKKPLPPKTPT